MSNFLVSVQEQDTGFVFGYVECIADSEFLAQVKVMGEVLTSLQYTKRWDTLKDRKWCLHTIEV